MCTRLYFENAECEGPYGVPAVDIPLKKLIHKTSEDKTVYKMLLRTREGKYVTNVRSAVVPADGVLEASGERPQKATIYASRRNKNKCYVRIEGGFIHSWTDVPTFNQAFDTAQTLRSYFFNNACYEAKIPAGELYAESLYDGKGNVFVSHCRAAVSSKLKIDFKKPKPLFHKKGFIRFVKIDGKKYYICITSSNPVLGTGSLGLCENKNYAVSSRSPQSFEKIVQKRFKFPESFAADKLEFKFDYVDEDMMGETDYGPTVFYPGTESAEQSAAEANS